MVSLPLDNAMIALVLSILAVTGITFIVYGVKRRAGHKFWDMIREKDFHPSLPRFQFLLWTWVVAFVFTGIFFIRSWAGVFPLPPEIPSNLLLLMGVSAAPAAISSGINQDRFSAAIQRVKNNLATFQGVRGVRQQYRNNGVALQTAADNARVLAEQSADVAARDMSVADFTFARAQSSQQAAQIAAQAAVFGGVAAQNSSALASQQATQLANLAVQTQTIAQLSRSTALNNELAAQVAARSVPLNLDIPLSDIFNEDGKPAITRFQMFVWTFISIIAYFIILGLTLSAMVTTTASELDGVEKLTIPNIDTTMLTLMGISQGAYVAGKMAKST